MHICDAPAEGTARGSCCGLCAAQPSAPLPSHFPVMEVFRGRRHPPEVCCCCRAPVAIRDWGSTPRHLPKRAAAAAAAAGAGGAAVAAVARRGAWNNTQTSRQGTDDLSTLSERERWRIGRGPKHRLLTFP